MKMLLKFIIVMLILCGVGYGVWYYLKSTDKPPVYRFGETARGDLVQTIAATGTLEPEEVVDVGAQVAGQILAFGKDANGKPIDYQSPVEEGMVLARIDDAVYQSDVANANALLASANAAVQKAKADVEQAKAKLYQTQRDWDRAQKLGPSDALSQVDYDQYQSSYEIARANVAVIEATVLQAQAQVAQAQANLSKASRNLGFTVIKSPVNGVIIDRRVNIGQTVVASLNAPSLFLIAKDLKRMQIWVAVNEADIGNIKPNQPVTFTVDAVPGVKFKGSVNKVRLNAAMTQSVVNYVVEVTADNSESKLLPYQTANVQFEVTRHEDVVMVPNAALRFTPRPEQIAPEESAAAATSQPSTRPSGSGRKRGSGDDPTRGMIWVQDGLFVKSMRVKVGITDGVNTEISGYRGKEINEGLQVIVGEEIQNTARSGGSSNPLMPQPMRGGGGRRGG